MTSAQPASLPTRPHGMLARQAVVDAKLAVRGYALVDRTPGAPGPMRDADFLLHVTALASSAALGENLLLFVRCTHEMLGGPHFDLLDPKRLVVELALPRALDADRIASSASVLHKARERGLQLALDAHALAPAWAPWAAHASFIRADFSRLEPAQAQAVAAAGKRLPHAQLVATNIHTEAEHHLAVDAGFPLLQGDWFARPIALRKKPILPGHAVILELVNTLRGDADPAAIEDVVKRDPMLSLNLLRLVNAAANGLRQEVTSLRQAVMLLGKTKLVRWSALLLASTGEGASPALARAAAVRGRLMEALAEGRLDATERDLAFVTGIFSLLDVITSQPIDQVLGAIALPASVRDALLAGTGPFAPYLRLAQACETQDDANFARAAIELKLTGDAINLAHLHALAWAENMLA